MAAIEEKDGAAGHSSSVVLKALQHITVNQQTELIHDPVLKLLVRMPPLATNHHVKQVKTTPSDSFFSGITESPVL